MAPTYTFGRKFQGPRPALGSVSNLNSSSKNIKITAGTSSFQEKTENKNIKGSVLSSRFN